MEIQIINVFRFGVCTLLYNNDIAKRMVIMASTFNASSGGAGCTSKIIVNFLHIPNEGVYTVSRIFVMIPVPTKE